jgi:hypothetical protein
MKGNPWKSCRSGTGAALVIVLAFIVLIAALMVIFFTQAISYRNMGNSSFNNFKSSALAQSGLATVVGDLQQEIINGSTTVSYGNGTNVYYPTGNTNAVPQRFGNPALVNGGDPTPNLIRISVRSDIPPSGSPRVSSRASTDSSTNAAASGQLISPARWNQHYLLPRASPGSTTIDTTPTNAFSAPDWVYVTSGGPTVITAPSSKVFGRYAYAIYDEGGLLDANIAGFPSNTATNSIHPTSPTTYQTNSYGAALPVWGSGLKGTEAFADLTAIGLTQTQIDQLVGWRNNATAQPTGTYNSYSFNTTSAVNYHDWMVNATNGFLTTSGRSWTDPTTGKIDTDQVFASRQSLIAFANDATPPISQDALQYLGTFTRDTDQPSYNPPVGRPMVQSKSTTVTTAPFGAGNDMYQIDRATTAPTTNAPSDINPPALAVRVQTAFQRIDGSQANVKDPLIKKRFPLSRLSLFPTNEAAPSGAYTDTTTVAGKIYYYFGLQYVAASGTVSPYWVYNHDPANTTGIDKLNTVATLSPGRDADFFEILRAAINVGSVGKGAAYSINTSPTAYSSSGSAGYLDQAKDVQSQLQILQVGANIIDQAKADNYPTRIQFSGLPAYQVCGSEDLPYLYRIYDWVMRTGTTGSLGVILFQPALWDPYSAQSSSYVPSTSTPTSFRVRLGLDPTSGTTPTGTLTIVYGSTNTITTSVASACTVNTPNTMPAPITFNASATATSYWDFREPTMLAQFNKPKTASLASNTATTDPMYADYPAFTPDASRQMLGFLLVSFPWIDVGSGQPVYKIWTGMNGSNSSLRYYVDYLDPYGNWVTYDQKPVQPFDQNVTPITQVPQTSGGANAKTPQDDQSITPNSNNLWGDELTDPRTSRWGFVTGEFLNYLPAVTTGPDADASADPAVFSTHLPNGGISYGDHVGGRQDKAFIGGGNTYSYAYRGFQHGYWTENSVQQTYQTDTGDNNLRYNLDPDGVPRRKMAGYVLDTTEGGASASPSQPLTGLPEATSNYSSRPTMLHRPFRSVAELGYVFRDSPWGDLDFCYPESGDAALLDYFCVNETSNTDGLVAGRVNLNTRQAPVISALVSGALLDKDDSTNPSMTQAMGADIGNDLVARTSTTTPPKGPLMSRSDLVGRWVGSTLPSTSDSTLKTAATGETINPDTFYDGFAHDLGTSSVPSINTAPAIALIPRQREAVMRALTDVGTTRTWNLLIDLVAQSGQFPPGATGYSNFVVEGEKHYWLHVAIDRYTGKVIDSQLEVVNQ